MTDEKRPSIEDRHAWMRWRMKEAFEAGEPTRWFEELYASADRESEVVPWADLRPNPILMQWLDATGHRAPAARPDAPPAVPARAAVVGAALGDDVPPLVERGWSVTAFDISRTAMEWAAERWRRMADADPAHAAHGAVVPVEWLHADLLDLPAELLGTFDFVLEVYTFQALPPEMRDPIAAGLRALLRPGGEMLMIARTPPADDDPDLANAAPRAEPPPWPVWPDDVLEHFVEPGRFEVIEPPRVLPDPLEPQFRRLRAHLRAL
jgi:SAM-dependent methyltransferase